MSPRPGSVTVAVSEARARLRDAQRKLNHFLWSSELAYGLLVTSTDNRLEPPDQQVSVAFGAVRSPTWYPNYRGAPHYDAKVAAFIEQLNRNAVFVYRSVLISWYAYFEYYLEERVRPFVSRPRWGPLTLSLCIPELTHTRARVRARTVVLADLVRLIRNELVHRAFQPIGTVDDQKILNWQEERVADLSTKWSFREAANTVSDAIEHFVALALRQQAEAARGGADLPIEYFYTLYSFSNLDKLAFEIEEALTPIDTIAAGRIDWEERRVRRRDLVVPEPPE